ncbi:DUF4395 domain-containing protein [Nocardioides sp. ChNu-153]|uniref:DUF4395 domain-containing protein n=1 Tax=unclassified Nocardioides TaxID=2615069 RepID=UPI0024053A66|nr:MULTISPECIES: DUF4395 domain-containing protein [unclassified Nocardioides]MDF9714993.1 DUF4395 domain-containing protein [Nocardioides sp. ChNu-99]MDN7122262.1 DUF4395 domain-containing protein [Nocardioides sp. ChNu-153]
MPPEPHTVAAPERPARPGARQIDPRGPQVAAGLTSVVLALVLVLGDSTAAVVLLAAQVAVFALGAAAGPQHTPYAWVFRVLVRPRLAPPAELEDVAPPRFAQAVGLVFTGVGLVALLAGAVVVAQVAVGLALVAALLNAVFALCLGCEVYLLARRATARA